MGTRNILIFDTHPDQGLGGKLKALLESSGFRLNHERVFGLSDPAERFSELLSRFSPDATFVVLPASARTSGIDLCKVFRATHQASPLIVIIDTAEQVEVAALFEHGATDFLIPPLRAIEILPRLNYWLTLETTTVLRLKKKVGLAQFVGQSPAWLTEIRKIPQVADCHATVLVAGETGTGKEIFARALHNLSGRAGNPFIAVNCGAMPVDLVENELFGHQPGAYTGAMSPAIGLVRQADGGTLFLDEVDSLPLLAQVKLLRLLQDKEYVPLGSAKICKADIRTIAATNINLEEQVRSGRFRQDLYYRLNVIQIRLPPLRERNGDIALLAKHFLAKFSAEFSRPGKELTAAAMQKLVLYDWPGNVRELENIVERAVLLSSQVSISSEDIQLPQPTMTNAKETFQALKARAIAQFEQQYITAALAQNGSVGKAARAAGKDRRAFWGLMRKHSIQAPMSRPFKQRYETERVIGNDQPYTLAPLLSRNRRGQI
jgi:DNA-binding NtrC family response regulator